MQVVQDVLKDLGYTSFASMHARCCCCSIEYRMQSAKASSMTNTRRRLTCSAQENCASGAKSVHAPEAGLLGEAPGTGVEAGAGLLGEVPGTGLEAGAGLPGEVPGTGLEAGAGLAEGLAAGVELVMGVVVGVGLVGGVVPGGQRLQVAAQ